MSTFFVLIGVVVSAAVGLLIGVRHGQSVQRYKTYETWLDIENKTAVTKREIQDLTWDQLYDDVLGKQSGPRSRNQPKHYTNERS